MLCLKKMFPRCIAIYDCTEFYTQMPSKLDLQGVVWSEYYHHHTAKALIGIILWGSVCFCSKLYPGGISLLKLSLECCVEAETNT
jgi:hypothetical protein